ncbi:MAG: AbrB/MazE/SpoVT family DNA-binding domain-containing protein [Candidatus Competibacteraceae bacterium]
MSVVRINQHFRITLPARLRERLNLVEGDLLEVSVRDNEIVLKAVATVENDVDAAITEGLNDYEEGRVIGPFANVEEFKSAINKT